MFGGKDRLQSPRREPGVEYAIFTDEKKIPKGWDHVFRPTSKEANPCIQAKVFKVMVPEDFLGYEWTLFMDARMNVRGPMRGMVEGWLSKEDMAQFIHPWSRCAYQEARTLIRLRKERPARVKRTVDAMRASGYPENNGLNASGFVARLPTRENTDFGKVWMDHIREYSHRDQLTFRWCCWKTGKRLYSIPGNIYSHKAFTVGPHLR